MAKFNGTLKDFEKFVGPRLRNVVQTKISKNYKKGFSRCQNDDCKSKGVLEAAHIHGNDRKSIIIKSLESNVFNNEIVDLDLNQFELRFIELHNPVEDVFLILCKRCHKNYDNVPQNPNLLNSETKSLKTRLTKINLEDNEILNEIIRVKKRVPLWVSKQRENNINATIFRSFMELLGDNEFVNKIDLENSCKKIDKFDLNFDQMSNIRLKNHGKVFDILKNEVRLWEPIKDFALDCYRNSK